MADKQEIQFQPPSAIMILANQYLWVILLVVMVLVLLLGYLFVLQPKIGSVKQAQIDTEAVIAKQVEVDDLIQRVTDLNNSYRAIEKQRSYDLRRLTQIIPDNPQIPELFVMVEQLALKRNFVLAKIDVSQTAKTARDLTAAPLPEGVSSVAINLQVTREIEPVEPDSNPAEPIDPDEPPAQDSYDAFKEFLSDLELNLRLFDVQTVSFTGVGVPDAKEISFNFTLLTYVVNYDLIKSSSGLGGATTTRAVNSAEIIDTN